MKQMEALSRNNKPSPSSTDCLHRSTKNWRIFYEIICGGHVPIILAITGLEQEKDMGRWWHDNKGAFQKYGMHPNGVACITATRGINGYSVAEEYRKSQVEMHRQIKTCCLERAWKVPTIELFTKVTEVRYEMRWYGLASPIEHKTFRTEAAAGLRKLAMQCELSEKEAIHIMRAHWPALPLAIYPSQ